MKDARQACRIPYHAPIKISWTSNGEPKTAKATCVGISLGGLTLEAPEPLPIGTSVYLEIDEVHLSGSASVRHSTPRGQQFLVGLELSPETREAVLNPVGN